MPESVSVIVNNPRVAHMAATQGWEFAREHTTNGRWVEIVFREADDIGTRQRNFYHGLVLLSIANQAVVDGKKHSLETWKEYFRALYVGWKWVSYDVPGKKRKKRVRKRISTEDLGVRKYAELVTQVMAYGATELGVEFEYRTREDWETHGQMRRAA